MFPSQLVLKCVAESNAIKKQLESPPNFDALFAEYEKKLGAELTAEVKAVADAAIAEAEAAAAADTTFAELEKEVNEAFKGSNGLVRCALIPWLRHEMATREGGDDPCAPAMSTSFYVLVPARFFLTAQRVCFCFRSPVAFAV